jgi:hypothetical protein
MLNDVDDEDKGSEAVVEFVFWLGRRKREETTSINSRLRSR